MKSIRLKKKRDASIRRFHPWVFSGAVAQMEEELEDGDWVEVLATDGERLGIGHFQKGSISVRILQFGTGDKTTDFWEHRLKAAMDYRSNLPFFNSKETNCYRLVHAEGDGLPGLIIDLYGSTAVLQCHSIGMYLEREAIANGLKRVLGHQLSTIFDKSADSLPRNFSGRATNAYLMGTRESSLALENGYQFQIDWEEGQKTGFFLDQRDNRQLIQTYAQGRSVLNTFSYTGGFSIYALGASATKVTSVDVSARAMELTQQNVQLNFPKVPQHESVTQDVMQFFRQTEEEWDLVVVDPPAFAKSLQKRHNAVQGYKRLNAQALRHVRMGGLMFTFSCSQVVDRQLFYDTITAAAIEAGRKVRVMHHLSQPPDHPVSLFHPEGSYLKGLAVQVE